MKSKLTKSITAAAFGLGLLMAEYESSQASPTAPHIATPLPTPAIESMLTPTPPTATPQPTPTPMAISPDLAITGVLASSVTDARGEDVTFRVSVTNKGSDNSAYFNLKSEFGDKTGAAGNGLEQLLITRGDILYSPIAPGETIVLEDVHFYKNPGAYTAKFTIDTQVDADLLNNAAEKTIETKVRATMGDRGIISVDKPVLEVGEKLTLQVAHSYFDLLIRTENESYTGGNYNYIYVYGGPATLPMPPTVSVASYDTGTFTVPLMRIGETCSVPLPLETGRYYSEGRLSRKCTVSFTASFVPFIEGEYSVQYLGLGSGTDEISFIVDGVGG